MRTSPLRRTSNALGAAAAAALALAALALSGCGTSADSTDALADLDFSTRIEPVWTTDVELSGTATVVDGYVVSYVNAADDDLRIAVWDARTGRQVWKHRAVTGGGTSGVEVSASTVTIGTTTYVTYLAPLPPTPHDWQRLVVADLATGIPVRLGEDRVWAATRPSACADGKDICFVGWIWEAAREARRTYRINVTRGTIAPDTDGAVIGAARMLGNRVFSTLDRPPDGTEMLGYARGGTTAWKRPYARVFEKGYSSDGGWWWHDEDAASVVVGEGAFYEPDPPGERADFDLTRQQTVGLDAKTGATIWKADATGSCIAAEIDETLIKDVIPLCRINSGVMSFTDGDDDTVADHGEALLHPITDLDVTLVGIDRATGKTRWSLDVGGDRSLISPEGAAFAASSAWRPVTMGNSTVLVNALTGKQKPVPAGAILACDTWRLTPLRADTPNDESAELDDYNTGHFSFACDAHRTRLPDATMSPAALRAIGQADADGNYVVSGETGLTGYRLG